MNSERSDYGIKPACKRGGFGGELSALIMEKAFDYLDAPVVRVAGVDVPVPYSEILERLALPDEKDILKGIKEIT